MHTHEVTHAQYIAFKTSHIRLSLPISLAAQTGILEDNRNCTVLITVTNTGRGNGHAQRDQSRGNKLNHHYITPTLCCTHHDLTRKQKCTPCYNIEHVLTLHPNDKPPAYTIPVTIQVEQLGEEGEGDEDNVRNGTISKQGEGIGKSKVIGAHMFLDSGATESNYVRQDVVSTLLRSHINKQVYLQPHPTNVCGAFGQCQLSSHCILIHITMPTPLCVSQCNDNKKEKSNKPLARIVPLLCKVLRSLPYDMIIGRPDIDRYNLWYLLRNARIEASPEFECKK
jgi:hypothetical protein